MRFGVVIAMAGMPTPNGTRACRRTSPLPTLLLRPRRSAWLPRLSSGMGSSPRLRALAATCWPLRHGLSSAGRPQASQAAPPRIRCVAAGAQAPHFPGQGQARHPPVHERRPVARRYLRSQAAWPEYAGKPLPRQNLRTERKTGAAFPSPFKFQKYGQSGIEVSELFPHVAAVHRRHLRHPLDACRRAQPRAVAAADELRRRPADPAQPGLVGHLRPGHAKTRTCPASSPCAPAAIRSRNRRTGSPASCPASTRAPTSTRSTPTSRS